VQAETKTLTQLFQLDVRYAIPLYQRPYVWSEEKQWAPLWDDIVTVANHVLDEGANPKSPSHFLGAIVIEQQENFPGSPQHFLVIDGQQRLTTLQLVLAAAAHIAQDLGCDDQGRLLRRLTLNDPLLAKGDERFKVWPTNTNRASFVAVMDKEQSTGHTEEPRTDIQQAYAFFCAQIRSWVSEVESDGVSTCRAFDALRVSLSGLVKLVAIRLEDGDNAQVIFETLNGRGTPLIALDLLKNAVFLKATGERADTDHLYSAYWEPELDQDYWRDNRRAGRLFTKNGDLFLQYWLVAELGEAVPATELFDTFRMRILQPAACPPMEQLIPAVARDATTLRRFQEADVGTPERRFSDLLDLLDTTTLMPVVLLLLRSDQVSAETRANAFSILESFLVRRMLCGWTTKNYNRLAASLIGAISEDLTHADTVLADRLASETASANRWPRDDDLRSVLLNKDIYGQRRQDRLVMVLHRIEEYLRDADSKSEQGLLPPSKLTLEHLIPQAWESHWPLDDSRDDPMSWRISHIHRLGNLTLTAGPLNSSISNLPWHTSDGSKDKRGSLLQHSLLKLNSSVVHDYPEHFDEHAVDERGARITEIITKLWPGPAGDAQATPNDGTEKTDGDHGTADAVASAPQVGVGAAGSLSREAIREQLGLGRTPAEIATPASDKRGTWLIALEEQARLAGELGAFEPTAENAVKLRDERQLRWERLAAALYGDASRVDDVRVLYEQANGPGSAKRSYTGRGRRFPDMDLSDAESSPHSDSYDKDDADDPTALQYAESLEPDSTSAPKGGTWNERTDAPVPFSEAKRAWELSAYDVLLATARRYNDYITYGELAEAVQSMSGIRTRSHMRNWIGGVLGAVSKRCLEDGEPPLSALCVKQDQRLEKVTNT
jgi:hypothetical protein